LPGGGTFSRVGWAEIGEMGETGEIYACDRAAVAEVISGAMSIAHITAMSRNGNTCTTPRYSRWSDLLMDDEFKILGPRGREIHQGAILPVTTRNRQPNMAIFRNTRILTKSHWRISTPPK